MPTTFTYPGVYVEEIPSGVRTITGVATSITAFVGRAKRGPTDEPRTINNYGDFERIYGGLWEESSLGYAVRDFYRNGGTQAVIVRLYRPTFDEGSTGQAKRRAVLQAAEPPAQATADSIAEAAGTEADVPAPDDEEDAGAANRVAVATEWAARAASSAARIVAAEARKAAGASGANAETVAGAADAAKEIGEEDSPERKTAKAVAEAAGAEADVPAPDDEEDAGAANRVAVATERAARAASSAARIVAAEARKAAGEPDADAQTVASAADSAVANAVLIGKGEAAPLARSQLSVGTLKLEARFEGAWGNNLRARANRDTRDSLEGEPPNGLFNLIITDGDTGLTEQIRNVSVVGGHARQVDRVLSTESQLVRVPVRVPDTLPANPPATGPDVEVVGDRASDGEQLENDDFNGTGKAANKLGIYQLEKVDLFNLLCIPPYTPDENVDQGVITDAVKYCEDRRAFLILDPPTAWIDKDEAKKGMNGEDPEGKIDTRSKNAAVFFPRFMQPNPLREDRMEQRVPCGVMAGVFARTDAQRGVWKAPAGLAATLSGVQSLSVRLTDPEIGELNPLGVNCLRVAPAAGPVAWGARTLEGDDRLSSDWKYIPVRRLALFIEESLYRGTQWVVFEPNDEPLWSQIRLNVGAFMRNLFRQGAFQGDSPRKAYFVKCDNESTTQNDINLGIVNIVVGFAPLKPAEFVVLKIQQIAGEIQT